eukprot:TRINITY_DN12951_c0_g1_i1.p1 TRINITY_DN12951_c0_g1~~TRINITY_DN12951_c0_g1_i1.p1  ORF type:complete len:267 (-),score=60.21 TRINITY_DN12951_c0_g1_i1:275-1036(-)
MSGMSGVAATFAQRFSRGRVEDPKAPRGFGPSHATHGDPNIAADTNTEMPTTKSAAPPAAQWSNNHKRMMPEHYTGKEAGAAQRILDRGRPGYRRQADVVAQVAHSGGGPNEWARKQQQLDRDGAVKQKPMYIKQLEFLRMVQLEGQEPMDKVYDQTELKVLPLRKTYWGRPVRTALEFSDPCLDSWYHVMKCYKKHDFDNSKCLQQLGDFSLCAKKAQKSDALKRHRNKKWHMRSLSRQQHHKRFLHSFIKC